MYPIRIIPKIDIKGPNLVKGINLEGYRVLGRPWDFAKYYSNNGADEIVFYDVVASLYKRNILFDIINKASENIFVPITVAGGIRTIGDISYSLRNGADKVGINSAALKNPYFISKASNYFGSANIVLIVEAIKYKGFYFASYENGRENSGKKVIDWIIQAEKLGAGEVLLTSVERDGTGKGFDIDLINSVNNKINIPIIVNGGFCSLDHIKEVTSKNLISGLVLSSMLHYNTLNYIKVNEENNNLFQGNRNFINQGIKFKKFGNFSILDIKNNLFKNGFKVRI